VSTTTILAVVRALVADTRVLHTLNDHGEKRSGRKMRSNQQRSLWFGVSVLGVLTLSPALFGQASPSKEATIPVPNDWSHHSLIFSRPATTEQARRVEQDPRYWQQRYRSQVPVMLPAPGHDALASELRKDNEEKDVKVSLRRRPRKADGFWGESLGSGGSVGAGNYPAKFSFLGTSANCGTAPQPDFVVYVTGLQGSGTQASIVAYDNLYSGCGGTVPSGYWAYNTGGQILTSPVYSLDGKQVAFVETSGGLGILVLLKWAPSASETVGAPDTLIPVSNAAYPGCTAPCMTEIFLVDGSGTQINDTTSSAFVDYSGDTAWVGGALGWLHKITPLFNGVPGEVVSGGFPVQVNNGNALASPVHDPASGNVFVGDYGGFLYRVNPSTAAVTKSGQLDFGAGIVSSPEVDSTAGLVYVFSSSDGTANCASGATACTAVYVLSAAFGTGTVGSEAVVGDSVAHGTLPNPSPLYDGDFDSTYKNSVNATGNLYVCGNTGGPPILYQVPIAAGVFGTVNPGPVLSNTTTPCSPVTDIQNPNATGGATEWIFESMQAQGVSSGCAAAGCIFNFKVTPWQPSTVYTLGQEVLDSHFQIQVVSVGGTSGTTAPTWSTTVDGLTHDGTTLIWVDQGVQSAFTPGSWAAGFAFSVGTLILDSNGNIERCIASFGTSGPSAPTWSTTPGNVTPDFDVFWENLGASATAALATAGGTSAIIIDNMVGSGTLAGTSQVYFSTLSDQATCGTSSTVGCAVQASQSALK